jgi:hypothetical protein
MRPKKKILVAGDDVDRVTVVRYLLWVHKYRVFTADSAAVAEKLLELDAPIDLLLVVWPLEGALKLLERAKAIDAHTGTLVAAYDQDHLPLGWAPDSTIGRAQYSAAEILEGVKLLCARKRGPSPGFKKPVKRAESEDVSEGLGCA